MTQLKRYVVVGKHAWVKSVFEDTIVNYPGQWQLIQDEEDFSLEGLREFRPRYVFFLHWSSRVPRKVVDQFECVCFHMTDLPYGRGGSPLQNLILHGHERTRLTAFQMVPELDAGPVYLKEPLALEGSAEEIYSRMSKLAGRMIGRFIDAEVDPIPQQGEIVKFRRRRPDESEIAECVRLVDLYDFLRMLDAEGYPRAFLDHRGFHYEFRDASLSDGQIEARVTITKPDDSEVSSP